MSTTTDRPAEPMTAAPDVSLDAVLQLELRTRRALERGGVRTLLGLLRACRDRSLPVGPRELDDIERAAIAARAGGGR